jgi:hypothetical protein
MADLLTEAKEDLQREQLKNLWDRYGLYLIALIAGSIIATGSTAMYTSWDRGVKEQQTVALLDLQNAKDYPSNILNAEKLAMRPALKAMAYLNAAAAFMRAQDEKNALTLYERVSENSSAPAEFKDLGTLMSVRILANDPAQKGETLIARLEPLYASAKNPWAAHARLEAAVLTAHKLSDFTKARAHLAAVLEMKDLPETLYQKAQALDHVYALQQNGKDKPTEPKTVKTDKKS